MKIRTLFTAALLAVSAFAFFTACDDEGENEKLNPDYRIYISGRDDAGNKAATLGKMTAHEICVLDSICLISQQRSLFKFSYTAGCNGDGYFPLDTVNDRLVLQAGNINGLEDNPFLSPAQNWVVGTLRELDRAEIGDTIGYVPTAQRLAVVDTLTTLFADGREKNIDAILEIFQSAFVFYPCTAEEYKELAAKGLN